MEPDERHEVLLQLAESLEVGGRLGRGRGRGHPGTRGGRPVGDARRRRPGAHGARGAGPQAGALRRGRGGAGRGRGGVHRPRSTTPGGHGSCTCAARSPRSRGTRAAPGRPTRRASPCATRLGDEAGVAALLTNLALVAEDEDDLAEAERLGLEGLARRRALDDRRAVSVSLTNMGMLATARGELRSAHDRFVEAEALAEEVGDRLAGGRRGGTTSATSRRDLGDLAAAAAPLRVGAARRLRRTRRPLVPRAPPRGRRAVAAGSWSRRRHRRR